MTQTIAIKAVFHEGRQYIIAGEIDARGPRFWVEQSPGRLWLHLSEHVNHQQHGMDAQHEILAATWDDPSQIMKQLAYASGWFEMTGRTVNHPVHQVNEVWRLSRECLDMLRPNRSRSCLTCDSSPLESSDHVGISQLQAKTLERIKLVGYSSFFLLRPDPTRERGAVHRSLVCATTEPLRAQSGGLEMGPGRPHETAFEVNLETDRSEWGAALVRMGYRTAQVLRIPVSGAHCYEFVALSFTASLSDAAGHAVVYEFISRWSSWHLAVQRELCPLSMRERAALKAVASGLNGAEASEMLGCVERTFRLHVDNAKKKVFASSAAEAAYKAHLLCAF